MSRRLRWVLAAVALSLTACSKPATPPRPSPAAPQSREVTETVPGGRARAVLVRNNIEFSLEMSAAVPTSASEAPVILVLKNVGSRTLHWGDAILGLAAGSEPGSTGVELSRRLVARTPTMRSYPVTLRPGESTTQTLNLSSLPRGNVLWVRGLCDEFSSDPTSTPDVMVRVIRQ